MATFDELHSKINSINKEGHTLFETYQTLWECAMNYSGEQLLTLVNKLKEKNDGSPHANCLNTLSHGTLYTFHPQYGNALDTLRDAENKFSKINDKAGEGAAQSLISLYLKNSGQLDVAQENAQKSIQNIGDNKSYLQFLCISYYQVGEMHYMLKDYSAAVNSFTTGLKFAKDGTGILSRLMVGLAAVYKDTNELEKAYELFHKILIQIKGKNNSILESKVYSDLGNYYYRKGNFEESIAYQEKSIAIRVANKMNNPLITNYIELAELHLAQNNLEKAIAYAKQAEVLAEDLKIILKQCQVSLISSKIYEAMGNTNLALEYYKKYHLRKEEVFSQESARQIKQLSMRHEMETMENEKELFKLRNVVLKEALDEIESSVRYAQRIQEAILPPLNLIQEKLSNTFVLYKPKDVVAGDFYWMEEINDTILIAAADCTGHGVPGAMVSVVCSNALNRAVKEFDLTNTGEILDKVTDLVLETFEKSVTDVKDGMDISLLSINKKTKQIQWSGANNPLWYFEENELKELTADKQPIGKSDHRKPFNTHALTYQTNTIFYLFTDGFADQFGGPKGKKFMYKQFKDLLIANSTNTMDEQSKSLLKAFNNWKGELDQVDDVCIIGIKL